MKTSASPRPLGDPEELPLGGEKGQRRLGGGTTPMWARKSGRPRRSCLDPKVGGRGKA